MKLVGLEVRIRYRTRLTDDHFKKIQEFTGQELLPAPWDNALDIFKMSEEKREEFLNYLEQEKIVFYIVRNEIHGDD